MTTGYKCPACGKPLRALYMSDLKAWAVYCANGKCGSEVSNEGREGETIEQAVRILGKAIDNE